jgi:hypothetical protein
MDGTGVVSGPMYSKNSGGDYLIDESNCDVLATFNGSSGPDFAQPVFADAYLVLASAAGLAAFQPPAAAPSYHRLSRDAGRLE